jgi:NAD(P)-dependent dehydrogenase (short-subunit alcohol dehydrogenase family)
MAKLGARLFLTDINEKGLFETARMAAAAGGEVCIARAFDISKYNDVEAFAADIHKGFGPVDILINNAGIALFALIEDMTHEHWEKIVSVNLWGPIHGVECFVPAMIRAGCGHIVNVSSVAGLAGLPWHAAYSTTKWGIVGLSEVLRLDLARHNIGVTVICPGAVDTPLKLTVEILGVDRGTEKAKKLEERFVQHSVTPERVADLIVNAIEKNKFLVVTSADIKALYFFKRHFPPAYNLVVSKINRLLDDVKKW